MTDKQILIDGCDVSKCEHSYISTSLFEEKTYAKCCAFFLENEDSYCDCTDNPNCYYKQLKLAEQKLEKIKQFRHDYCMNCEDLLKSSHSCKGCNMVELKHLIEE